MKTQTSNIMNKTYNYYYDDGHGWLNVSFGDVKLLGIFRRLSGYSYYNMATGFYLEEDRDAALFIDAYKVRFGYPPAIKEVYDGAHCHCRNYDKLASISTIVGMA